MTTTIFERFSQKIEPEPMSGCWLWTGSIDRKGYGKLYVTGRWLGAHRVSWMLFNGDIPRHLSVLHKCDVPSCANPNHLWLGTQIDNLHDMLRKGRGAVGDKNGSRKHPERMLRGEQLPGAKLTSDEVVQIHTLSNRGVPSRLLELRFGVSQSHISRLKLGQRWGHILCGEKK